ncbi:nucleoside hydrolase [Algoriphagus aquimarinus]|uniref:Inosine-uridine preferring nucleoside hydrolase n=1 Tax=Algoriphagus aquimarinus TaxID=237018 RepID=A0A1I1B6K5_9BACT|nr:nucleoside hydrolase [Algoriphagus aquimarinus]SFB45911.1 Inosine-uridine preferring nucleoside hydrolase [Algoriphagus aquimarinus]
MHRITLSLISIFLLTFFISCKPEETRIPIIIDADTANEVDDLYALVRAILEPSFDLRGITSAQWHTSPIASDSTVRESQVLNEDIIRLMNRQDIPLPLGANMPIESGSKPAISPASNFIIEQAKQQSPDNPLRLVILGSCTNVASAILQDPTIIPNIQVHYLGIWHDAATNHYNKKEFNSGNDTLAVEVLFNTPDLDLIIMSATASQALVFEKKTVDAHLKGKSELGDYLVARWDSFDRFWTEEDKEKKRWIMWDVAIIESLINPAWSSKSEFLTPPENTPRLVQVHTKLDAKAMEVDFWKSLDMYSQIAD